MLLSRPCWRSSLFLVGIVSVTQAAPPAPASQPASARPNIVIILADDMGFSDAGCYGSEIATPNIDRLAAGGLRFTQFYNAARCCPTRASLLTGLYPHQCGVGHMTDDHGVPGYRGVMSEQSVTVAEVLRQGGYRTFMSGKWHLGMKRQQWPIEHGFDRYFGQLSGACNYFRPERGRVMALDGEVYQPPADHFYITDAITDYALQFLDEAGRDDRPFFLYVTYTAPHAPLHALADDIARYRGKYRIGWDAVRQQRYQRMIELDIIKPTWSLSPRNWMAKAWEEEIEPDEQDLRMAVYAAQVDRMDQGIGRILQRLAKLGCTENTLVLFLSDNGGDSEDIDEGEPGAPVGTAESYRGYAPPWANVSNTPFRNFKRQVHEGGIATPLVAYWPAVIRQGGGLNHEPGHVIDLMGTCCDIAGVRYPTQWQGKPVIPTPGRSLVPLFARKSQRAAGFSPADLSPSAGTPADLSPPAGSTPADLHPTVPGASPRSSSADPSGARCLFWEHEGNRAVRCGQYKLVALSGGDWELYDMDADRTELNNLAASKPDVVKRLQANYDAWARDCNVLPPEKLPPQIRAK